jgi:hydrogenase nickel incorporation protein HypA/HybF
VLRQTLPGGISMHEMGLAQNIFDIVLRTAEQNGVGKILRINIRAGQLRGIVPEQLQFCFGFVAKESEVVDGAELVVETLPIKGKCKSCQHAFDVEEYRFVCPECAHEDIDVLQGMELLVSNIEAV